METNTETTDLTTNLKNAAAKAAVTAITMIVVTELSNFVMNKVKTRRLQKKTTESE